MTSKKLLHGYLDSLSQNKVALDEALAIARKLGKSRKPKDRHATVQALKLVRDLVEVRNVADLALVKELLATYEREKSKKMLPGCPGCGGSLSPVCLLGSHVTVRP